MSDDRHPMTQSCWLWEATEDLGVVSECSAARGATMVVALEEQEMLGDKEGAEEAVVVEMAKGKEVETVETVATAAVAQWRSVRELGEPVAGLRKHL
jgi:hypothetical protein